jgi:hypothetical protein
MTNETVHRSELIPALLAEQHERWQKGDCAPVEEYAARHPGLADDPPELFKLIVAEASLRQARGQTPRLPEHVARNRPQTPAVGVTGELVRGFWGPDGVNSQRASFSLPVEVIADLVEACGLQPPNHLARRVGPSFTPSGGIGAIVHRGTAPSRVGPRWGSDVPGCRPDEPARRTLNRQAPGRDP